MIARRFAAAELVRLGGMKDSVATSREGQRPPRSGPAGPQLAASAPSLPVPMPTNVIVAAAE